MTQLNLISTFAAKNTFNRLFSWVKCCKKSSRETRERQVIASLEDMDPESAQPELLPQNTIVEDIRIQEEAQR